MQSINKIKSKVQKYWDRQPCNSKHSLKKKNSKEYFKEITKKRYFVEPHITNFANFKKYKNKNVLEIGCGIGTDAIEFIKKKANYVGVDYSKKSISIAKKRVEVLKLNKKNK
jgi:ubiquinone/menaquinone biosynthesis C-methylase UbiE